MGQFIKIIKPSLALKVERTIKQGSRKRGYIYCMRRRVSVHFIIRAGLIKTRIN